MRNHLIELARPIARHEVGHWLMAARQGFRPGDISIVLTDLHGSHRGGSEVTLACTLSNVPDVVSYLKRRMHVLFAGALAETLSRGGEVDTERACALEKGSAENDFKVVRELGQMLRSITHKHPDADDELYAQLKSAQDGIWESAVALVEEDHEIINGLADSIADRVQEVGLSFGFSGTELRHLPAVKTWLNAHCGTCEI